MKVNVVNLGRINYIEALKIQEKLFALRQKDKIQDTLLLLEHPAVITLGRRGAYSNIIISKDEMNKRGISVYEVSRGGDATYHGPGQIVGYPIVNLKGFNTGIKEFVWNLEELFIRLLKDLYNIEAHREEKKYTGVWVDNEKVTAIGIAIQHWVTMHGFAFNANTNLEHYRWINPCGITDKGVTSLEKLSGQHQDIDQLMKRVAEYFCETFNLQPEILGLTELLNNAGDN